MAAPCGAGGTAGVDGEGVPAGYRGIMRMVSAKREGISEGIFNFL